MLSNQRNIFTQLSWGRNIFFFGGQEILQVAGGGWEKIDVNYCWTLQTPATQSEVWLGTEERGHQQGRFGGI